MIAESIEIRLGVQTRRKAPRRALVSCGHLPTSPDCWRHAPPGVAPDSLVDGRRAAQPSIGTAAPRRARPAPPARPPRKRTDSRRGQTLTLPGGRGLPAPTPRQAGGVAPGNQPAENQQQGHRRCAVPHKADHRSVCHSRRDTVNADVRRMASTRCARHAHLPALARIQQAQRGDPGPSTSLSPLDAASRQTRSAGLADVSEGVTKVGGVVVTEQRHPGRGGRVLSLGAGRIAFAAAGGDVRGQQRQDGAGRQ